MGRCNLARDKPVSRKAAKYAKFAKESKDFSFALLCALAPWRELF
jgi:hypothetical protein